MGLIHITPESAMVSATADLALFAVLFTDGMHVSFRALKSGWRNPARALGLGMPLACVGVALCAYCLAGLDWTTPFLVGAVLAPADPVFASAIVGRKEVPAKLRQLLNVESGINDGLALPVVLLLIAAAGPLSDHAEASAGTIVLEPRAGLAFGIVLPLLVTWLVLPAPGRRAEAAAAAAARSGRDPLRHLPPHARQPVSGCFLRRSGAGRRIAGGQERVRAARRGTGGRWRSSPSCWSSARC